MQDAVYGHRMLHRNAGCCVGMQDAISARCCPAPALQDRQTLRALQDNEFLSDHTAPESMLASLQEMQEQIVRLRQELDGSPQNPEKASACAP